MLVALVALAFPAAAQTPSMDVQVTVLGHSGVVAGSASEHFLTFSAPVEIPGVALAQGAYIFRFLTPSVVQVLNENRTMVYAMFLVTPKWRNEVTNEYSIALRRVRDDAPARLMTLYPPGASTGYELTYPKREIAAEAEIAMK